VEVNVGDEDYRPLFPYGYGLSYEDSVSVSELSENPDIVIEAGSSAGRIIEYGDPVGSWRMILRDGGESTYITDVRGVSQSGALSVVPADLEIQEDSLILSWTGPASMVIDGPRANYMHHADEDQVLELTYQVLESGAENVSISVGGGEVELSGQFAGRVGMGLQTSHISLACFIKQGADLDSVTEPLMITADNSLKLQIMTVRLVASPRDGDCEL
jgi:beta-glucosidase